MNETSTQQEPKHYVLKVEEPNEAVIGDILTPKQELFCRYYTQNTELFGNATLSYAEAYGYDLDNASKDDAVYILKSMETVDQETFNDLPTEQTKGYKIHTESTYKRMYDTCSSCSHRMLRNDKIDKRIVTLLNEIMTDEQVDAEIAKVMKQNSDLGSKMRAIAEYNKLRQRIVDKKDITSGGEKIAGFQFLLPEEQTPAPSTLVPLVNIELNDETNNTNNQTDKETGGSVESPSVQ